MKLIQELRALCLSIILISLVIPTTLAGSASGQTNEGAALQRGFRTGYSDGYMSGYRDSIDGQMQSFTRHTEYIKAERAYNREYGPLEDYRDGYQQGFESGYLTGYERRSFESTVPTELKKRGAAVAATQQSVPVYTNAASVYQSTAHVSNDTTPVKTDVDPQPVPASPTEPLNTSDTAANPGQTSQAMPAAVQFDNGPVIIIPTETELILELQDDLNTETGREGQKFTARVISPSEISGATIEGRVSRLQKPGKVKRRSEMLLSFDRIILNDSRWSNFNGTLIEVMAIKGDNIRRVDSEGTAVGHSSIKADVAKVGGATGAGLVVGAVVGGPVGAAVGAGMGAAFGVGAIVIDRGKHIRLNRNQQVRIKTAHETQIR